MLRGRTYPAVLLSLLLSCSGCDQERQVAAEGNKQAAPADASQSPRAQRVRQIIGELLGVPAARVVDQASIRDLGGDSLDFVEIIMTLEEEFSVEISDEDAERLKTVGDLISYVERPR